MRKGWGWGVTLVCSRDIYQGFPIGKSEVWTCPIGDAGWCVGLKTTYQEKEKFPLQAQNLIGEIENPFTNLTKKIEENFN